MPQPESGNAPAIHVLLRKEELDPGRLSGKTVVVVDVLFATTSIVAALDAGASAVYPATNADEARDLSVRDDMDDPVLAGESMFQFIEGFVQPTPLALRGHVRPGTGLIYTTTNGTVALRSCTGARRVMAGALINAGATAEAIGGDNGGTILILCAGTAGAFNLEDFYGAGCLVERILARRPGYRLTDSAMAARDYFKALEAGPALSGSLVGRLMHQWGLDEEVAFAASIDETPVAAELRGDRVVACS